MFAASVTFAQAAEASPLVGQVVDGQTMEPLAGAVVHVRGTEARVTTDTNGGFAFADENPGRVILEVTFEGYDQGEQVLNLSNEGTSDAIIVMFRVGEFKEQIVLFDRPPLVKLTPGHTEFTQEELLKVPGARGDALHAVRNLPGVANFDPLTPGEYAFGLIIRGVSPEDSMYFVNGIELPMLYHFFGLQSVLPSEMIDRVEYIPGGFDVQYGRSTGGIVNIHTRPSRTTQWTGSAELSLLNATAFVEGPLTKDNKLRLSAGFRRSIFDLYITPMIPEDVDLSFAQAPHFYDAQLRIDWDPAPHHNLMLMVFTSWDLARGLAGDENPTDPSATGAFKNGINFSRAALSWHYVKNGTESFARLWVGDGHFDVFQGESTFQKGDGKLVGGRTDFSRRLLPWLRLRTGAEFQFLNFEFTARFPLPPTEGQPGVPNSTFDLPVILDATPFDINTAGAYLAADLDLGSRVDLTVGLRWDGYLVTDYQTLSPRATVSVDVSPQWKLRSSLGKYTRTPGAFEAQRRDLEPETSMHYVVGAEYAVATGVNASLTGYVNDMKNLVVMDPTLIQNSPFEGWVNRGEGISYGTELTLRMQKDNLFGWVSYTLSRGERSDGPGMDSRLFDYDQTHNVNIAASWQHGPWRYGGRVTYATGRPETPITGAIYNADLDVYQPQFGAVNSERLGPAHQLDLRIDREWKFDHLSLSAYLDVTNVYAHAQTLSYQYNFNYTERKANTSFPIFPVLGVRGTL